MNSSRAPGTPGHPEPALTRDQQLAAEAFTGWLSSPEDGTPFLLSGYAGTGKTHLSMRLLAQAEAEGLCWTVVAPTHKAVGVLRLHLERNGLHPTWYPSTIHRLLRLKLRREGDRERCEETSQTATALEHLQLVLVDEASMVDGALLAIALRCAQPFRCRLVFIGDPAQLPPVGERQSPVFALSRVCRASLTHVVRHQGPVLRLATGVRLGTLPCSRPPLLPRYQSARGLVALVKPEEWLQEAQMALRRSAETDNPDRARILCYTNRRLEQLVPMARRALHGDMADSMPVLPGEVLITRSAVLAPACVEEATSPEDPELCLSANREVVVRDVKPGLFPLAEWGSLGEEAPTTILETLMVSVDAGDCQLTLRLLPAIGTVSRRALDQTLEGLRSAARGADKAAARRWWRSFFLIRDAFASLGPAAVLTVHRSQGSTFGEVFVAGDVFWPKDEHLRRQLVYVAVSRASQGVTLEAGPGPPAERQQWQDWLAGSEEDPPESGRINNHS